MAIVYDPKYILRLDELPKVVESDGVVYPVFLPLRDAARLFGVTPEVILAWHQKHDLPILRYGGHPDGRGSRVFIEVAAMNDWIRAHSVPRPD